MKRIFFWSILLICVTATLLILRNLNTSASLTIVPTVTDFADNGYNNSFANPNVVVFNHKILFSTNKKIYSLEGNSIRREGYGQYYFLGNEKYLIAAKATENTTVDYWGTVQVFPQGEKKSIATIEMARDPQLCGDSLFFTRGMGTEGSLYRYDILTGIETQMLKRVARYAVTENHIFWSEVSTTEYVMQGDSFNKAYPQNKLYAFDLDSKINTELMCLDESGDFICYFSGGHMFIKNQGAINKIDFKTLGTTTLFTDSNIHLCNAFGSDVYICESVDEDGKNLINYYKYNFETDEKILIIKKECSVYGLRPPVTVVNPTTILLQELEQFTLVHNGHEERIV